MQRLNKIDILRAYGIVLMVAGHTFTFFGKFDRYIHTFHMPLFFVISGYLYRSKEEVPLYRLILQKVKRLLIPYLTFAIINYIAWLFLVQGGQVWYEPLVNLFTYNTSGLPICGALWFLSALFWTEVFYMILDRVIKISWLRSIVVFAIALASCTVQNYTEFRLPFTLDIGLACMGFYEIGRLFKSHGAKVVIYIAKKSIVVQCIIASLLLVTNAVLAFVNDYVNIKSGWYGNIPLFWLNAVLGITAFAMIASLADILFRDENVIKRLLIFLGKGSIIFLGLNQLLIVIGRIVFRFLGNQWIQGGAVLLMVITALSLIYLFLNKIKNKRIRLFFGI